MDQPMRVATLHYFEKILPLVEIKACEVLYKMRYML